MKMDMVKKALRHVRKDLLLATEIEETEVVTAEVVEETVEAAAVIADREDRLQKKMGLLMGGFFFAK